MVIYVVRSDGSGYPVSALHSLSAGNGKQLPHCPRFVFRSPAHSKKLFANLRSSVSQVYAGSRLLADCLQGKLQPGNTMCASSIAARYGIRVVLVILTFFFSVAGFSTEKTGQDPGTSQTDKPATTPAPAPVLPRGKKLMLKDGTYQVIREYQRNGDHVRYYSLERGDWEEVPASLVDWDATAKMAGDEEKAAAAQVEKIHKQEEARRMDNVADIDASLQVGGKGAFLPEGEGMFVVEGKSVRIMDQVAAQMKADKLRTLEQIMSPVPMVPGKQNIVLPGTRAALRLKSQTPEFYLREPPPDPEKTSTIQRSKRAGDNGPDVELIRAKVVRNGRQLESISTMFGEQVSKKRNSISIQRWEIAPDVYRFTLSEPLPPGEYILAQIAEEGLDIFVWEFGVDELGATAPGKK
jgi:hypothetical protein